jgi:hypothetical protein
MSLNKPVLKNGIKTLLDDMLNREENSNDEYADRLSTLIDTFVKSATVTVAIGIPVSTAGSAISQTGATTSTGTATIS